MAPWPSHSQSWMALGTRVLDSDCRGPFCSEILLYAGNRVARPHHQHIAISLSDSSPPILTHHPPFITTAVSSSACPIGSPSLRTAVAKSQRKRPNEAVSGSLLRRRRYLSAIRNASNARISGWLWMPLTTTTKLLNTRIEPKPLRKILQDGFLPHGIQQVNAVDDDEAYEHKNRAQAFAQNTSGWIPTAWDTTASEPVGSESSSRLPNVYKANIYSGREMGDP